MGTHLQPNQELIDASACEFRRATDRNGIWKIRRSNWERSAAVHQASCTGGWQLERRSPGLPVHGTIRITMTAGRAILAVTADQFQPRDRGWRGSTKEKAIEACRANQEPLERQSAVQRRACGHQRGCRSGG